MPWCYIVVALSYVYVAVCVFGSCLLPGTVYDSFLLFRNNYVVAMGLRYDDMTLRAVRTAKKHMTYAYQVRD